MALYPVVKENFQIYHEVVELMATFVDRFMDLDIPKNVKSDYPEVEKITQMRLDVMDDLIREKTAVAQGENGRETSNDTGGKESTSDEPKDELEAKEDKDANASKTLPQPEDAVKA